MSYRKLLFTAFFAVIFAAFSYSLTFAAIDTGDYERCPVYFNGSLQNVQSVTVKGNAYIKIEDLKKYGDTSSFEFDEDMSEVVFSPQDMNIFIADQETTEFIKKYCGSAYIPSKTIDGSKYVSLNSMAAFSGLEWSEENNIVYISEKDLSNYGYITKNTDAVGSLLLGSGYAYSLKKGTHAYLTASSFSFCRLELLDGDIVYVNKDCFELSAQKNDYDFVYQAKTKKDYSQYMINLSWVAISNSVNPLAPKSTNGVDILAPTWFRQGVGNGAELTNFADRGYVDLAHRNGFDVWMTVDNCMSTKGSTVYTLKVLSDEKLRNKLIAQMLFYAAVYDADGINIDYEDLIVGFTSEEKALLKKSFAAFLEDLSYYCNRMGLYCSVDVATPESYNLPAYDYDRISAAVDYVCVMTYDEYYSGSSYAGSVSDKGWYTSCMKKMCGYVPSEKLLMGVPFYTRSWLVDGSNRKKSSTVFTMGSARSTVEEEALVPVWLENSGQYYVEYPEDGYTRKIWLEDERSVSERLRTAQELGLAGTCCWQFAQGDSYLQEGRSIWNVFYNIFRLGMDPDYYANPY